jgi:hypothetical protein
MENILRKSDLTVGKLQMQVVDKGFYLCVSKASEVQAELNKHTVLLEDMGVGHN